MGEGLNNVRSQLTQPQNEAGAELGKKSLLALV